MWRIQRTWANKRREFDFNAQVSEYQNLRGSKCAGVIFNTSFDTQCWCKVVLNCKSEHPSNFLSNPKNTLKMISTIYCHRRIKIQWMEVHYKCHIAATLNPNSACLATACSVYMSIVRGWTQEIQCHFRRTQSRIQIIPSIHVAKERTNSRAQQYMRRSLLGSHGVPASRLSSAILKISDMKKHMNVNYRSKLLSTESNTHKAEE